MVRSQSPPGRARSAGRSPHKLSSPNGKSPKAVKSPNRKVLLDSEFDPFPQVSPEENDDVGMKSVMKDSSDPVANDSTDDTSNDSSASHSNGITTDQNQFESDLNDMPVMPPPWRTTLEQRRSAIKIATSVHPPPVATDAIRMACAKAQASPNMDTPPLPDSAVLPEEANGSSSRVQPGLLPGGPPRRDRVLNVISHESSYDGDTFFSPEVSSDDDDTGEYISPESSPDDPPFVVTDQDEVLLTEYGKATEMIPRCNLKRKVYLLPLAFILT